jgi:hypothetical protein
MALHQDQTTLARITEEIEEDVARLYQAYGDEFPEYADFWSGLVMEQIDHANTIHGLMNKVRGGLLKCSEDRFDCQALELLRGKVQQEIIRARQGQISATEALAIALEIEKIVSRREYSEALDEDSGEVRAAFSYLASNTQKRMKWIEEHLKKTEGSI